MFYIAAALQIVDSLVVTAANIHNATQRVAPYGQFTNPAVPLVELAVQDAVVSTALGATHASCRAREDVVRLRRNGGLQRVHDDLG